MRTPTLSELRRVLGAALLAAPLAMACRKDPKATTKERPAADATITHASTIDAGSRITPPPRGPDAAPAPDATPTPAGICKHSPPDITGCGGAEVRLLEDRSACGLPAKGDLPEAQCDAYCGGFDTASCHVYDDGKGIFCNAANPCLGRAPSAPSDVPCTQSVDEHLALARRVEAHSVAAFRELGRDLARWGAPARLQRACARAARDEARHAAAMTRLLRRRGVAPGAVARPAAPGFASLRALALHNEREGVIGETWGALVAQHQAAHAADPEVRAAMAAIADEEAAHAQLAFEIAAWARTVLGDAELDAARADALAALRATLGYRPGDDAAAELGWPSRDASAAMLDALAPAFC